MLFDAVGTRLNNTDKTKMLNVVRTILFGITQPETPQTCCKLHRLYRLDASCHQVAASLLTSSSCSKSVRSDLLQIDICRLAASCYNNLQQACGYQVLRNLPHSNLQQVG